MRVKLSDIRLHRAAKPTAAKVPSFVPSEHEEQKALMVWATAQIGRGRRELAALFAIPNGGDRHPAVAGKLKAEGVSPGVPDLLLPVPTKRHHGLFIEMKRTTKGRLSDAQKVWHTRLLSYGYAVVVCKGAAEAIACIEAYLGRIEKEDGL